MLATPTSPRFVDAALARAFPTPLDTALAHGARGRAVTAVQYALGRLGFLRAKADGSFGPATAAAVTAFQRDAGLPQSGEVDEPMLAALDARVSAHDGRPPAARAPDPLAYLSDFDARGLARVEVRDRTRAVNWTHPEIEAAYERFVGEYWQVLKENVVEADCKTMAAFIMDQFRTKVRKDTDAQLVLPGTRAARIAPMHWQWATAAVPRDWFTRVDKYPTAVRPGYEIERAIEELDPKHSMIFGVNIRPQDIATATVASAAETVADWDRARDNHGDATRPEIPLDVLRPGMLLFIDHDGQGGYDHTVTIVAVGRDASTRVRELRLSVGSYDDMKDADHATPPRGVFEINSYAEEVVVTFDERGRIIGSDTPWTSEPVYISPPHYNAANSIMELRPHGRVKVCRWNDPPA